MNVSIERHASRVAWSGWSLAPGTLPAVTGAMLVVTALAAIASGQAVPLQGTRIFAVPLQPATAVAADQAGDSTPAAAEGTAPSASSADPAAARIAKIGQLIFDRRPSVLLGGKTSEGEAAASSADGSAVPVAEQVFPGRVGFATATIRIVPATPVAGSTVIVAAAPAESPAPPPAVLFYLWLA